MPPLRRTSSPEMRPTPPRKGRSLDAGGAGVMQSNMGKALTVEERPSGMADKGKDVRGPPKKDGGSAPQDAAEWETCKRRDDEPWLELDVEQAQRQKRARARSLCPPGNNPGVKLLRKAGYWPGGGPLGKRLSRDRRGSPKESHSGRHKQQRPQNCCKRNQLHGCSGSGPPQTGGRGESKT
jgi:hypothetical protein